MRYTLGQAAKATGKGKTTIANAIEKGRISATKDELGQYQIDPSELHRVYPVTVTLIDKPNETRPLTRPQTEHDLSIKLARLEWEVEKLREDKARLEAEKIDLANDRDEWRIQAKMYLPKPSDSENKKGFWSWLIGKK